MPGNRHPTLEVMRNRDVRLFVTSRLFNALADSLLHATLAWHLWEASGSYFYLGVLGFVEFVPVIPVSLWAGAFADASDRRRIVLSTQGTAFLGAALLALGSGSASLELPLILGAGFVLAVASSFENPAGSSILPMLVSRDLFPTATVIMANARNFARMGGPVLMGAVAHFASIPAAYAASALCFALSFLSLLRVRYARSASAPLGRGRVTLAAIREGIAFVRSQPAILGSMTLDMFAVIFAGATALLPVYADEILGVRELGYGLLSASMQIGTFLMAAILLMLPPIERAGRALLVSVLFFGVSTIVFGLSRSFPLSLLAFIVAGMADQVSMVTRSIILQLSTPDALRGRVNSVNMIFIGASNELGAAESGFLAAATSATFSVVAGGFACLVALGIVGVRVPALRRYHITDGEPKLP